MLPKPTGAAVRLIPPAVYFVPFAVMWGLHWWRPRTIPGGIALTVLGLALILIGVALSLWAVATLMRAGTTFIPHRRAEKGDTPRQCGEPNGCRMLECRA